MRLLLERDIAHILTYLRVADQREMWALHWPGQEFLSVAAGARASMPMAHCMEWDGRPAVAIGARAARPGVWSVWSFGTDDFPHVGFAVTRWVRRTMIPALLSMGAHRLECLSIAGHDAAHRWIESCGGVHEATLRGFGRGGEDFRVYAMEAGSHDASRTTSGKSPAA